MIWGGERGGITQSLRQSSLRCGTRLVGDAASLSHVIIEGVE